jgi:hypothetical protein
LHSAAIFEWEGVSRGFDWLNQAAEYMAGERRTDVEAMHVMFCSIDHSSGTQATGMSSYGKRFQVQQEKDVVVEQGFLVPSQMVIHVTP